MTRDRVVLATTVVALLVIVGFIVYTFLFVRALQREQFQLRNAATNDLRQLSERISRLETKEEFAIPSPPFPYGEFVKVAKVIDGDTIELEGGERLRYIGIDTPESNDPRKPVQCFAKEATEKNRQLVEGEIVKFYKDVNERDKYQRLLGYVYRDDGLFVNLEMVRTGYAFSYTYPPDISKQTEFQEAEKAAREKKLGLWTSCTITENDAGRLETNPSF